jgi:hypothetical protein
MLCYDVKIVMARPTEPRLRALGSAYVEPLVATLMHCVGDAYPPPPGADRDSLALRSALGRRAFGEGGGACRLSLAGVGPCREDAGRPRRLAPFFLSAGSFPR